MCRARLFKSALVAVFLAFAALESSGAATLVMVDWAACSHCQRFHREVEPDYARSPAGQLAPLRRVSVLAKWPDDLPEIRSVHATPYFILVDNGREIGRFAGYSSSNLFWKNLDNLLSRR